MVRPQPEDEQERVPSWVSTTARPRAPRDPRERAEHRVAELLRAYGLTNLQHLARAIDRLLGGVELSGARDRDVEAAVREAHSKLDAWLPSVIGEADARTASTERLRALLARRPDALFDDSVDPDWVRSELGVGQRIAPPQLAPQPLRVGAPRWALGLLPSLVTATVSVGWLAPVLARDGWQLGELALAALLALLTGLNAIAVTLSVVGLVRRTMPRRPTAPAAGGSRTAVVIAIYNEDSERVFAGVAAMRESLAAAGAQRFEIVVASDTQDAEIAAAEERALRRLRAGQLDSPIPLYYRRRANNAHYKSGNLADFFVRWGDAYDYVVVLDADSLVEGDTLVELARRMDADAGLGLLQLPIEPVRATTPFARALQLTGQLYGPLFTEGLAAWSGSAGNYFGHNAIIRARAFVESCGLPELSGAPPFGGLILSHDFVEAALLRRAGWKVEIAADLGGSYEELPPTLEDFVARDRRWAQGNLQHLRVVVAEGLAPMSRVHLVLGALAYLSAPLWLAFLVLVATSAGALADPRSSALAAGVGALLLAPKLVGLMDALFRRERRRGFGGVVRLSLSWVLELALSALLAPILMAHHVVILLSILVGRAVGWKPQRRSALGGGMLGALRRHAWMPLLGAAVAGLSLTLLDRELTLWLAAIWAPLIASPLVSMLGASESVGRALRSLGVFRVPSETEPPLVVDRLDELRVLSLDDAASRFRDVVLDPVLNELHRRGSSACAEDADARLVERALRIGPAALEARERKALLASAPAMQRLHREAWNVWPVESGLVDRSRELAPPEHPS